MILLTLPTVTIEGDGYGCIAEAVVKDGKVVRVDMTNPSDYTVDTVANYGTGYSHATVVFSGSGGATARASSPQSRTWCRLRV